jgi:exodeoxyribonuclease VII large subunit
MATLWDAPPPEPVDSPASGAADGLPSDRADHSAGGAADVAASGPPTGMRATASRPTPAGAIGPRVLTVADLTRLVREAISRAPRLGQVWVEGEVGQVTVSSAGHCYFTLKDERAQLRCMIFRDDRMVMPLEPRTGIRIVAHGRVDVFEPQGAYQLYVDSLQPAGVGDLALRFEATKARLAAEGLFEQRRKRPLPPWPRNVGIVTSLSGAVLHDIRRVIARRWPLTRLIVSACQVQGPGAAESIVRALRRVGRWTDPATGLAVDVVIVARGGGSLEDLWAFNEESVVRAIAAHPRPVVVGVGHETDVTLSEFAADVRAATPSVAAELVVPDRVEQRRHLGAAQASLATSASRRLSVARASLESERRSLERFRPAAYLAAERERIGLLLDRATRAIGTRTVAGRVDLTRWADRGGALLRARTIEARTALERQAAGLAALDPFATLQRGYAIVRAADGRVVVDAASRSVGDRLDVRLARGALDVSVDVVRDSAT